MTLAGCWCQAQMQLYILEKVKAKAVLGELKDGWDRMQKNGKIPGDISQQPRNSIQYLIKDIDWMKIDFTHPRYWAPFVLVGRGGLVLGPKETEMIPLPSGHGDEKEGHLGNAVENK